jgi:hypothetical protein
MKTHKRYLEMFDMYSVTHSANGNAIFEFFPCTQQLTYRR